MRPWKAAVGVGAACAVCCAVPLVGGAAALTFGTATLAAMGSAFLTCADEFAPLAIALLGFAAIGAGVIVWRRRAQRPMQAELLPDGVPKACGCPPGACG
jgi:hypothetical protein